VAKNSYNTMCQIAAAICLPVMVSSATGCGSGPAAIPPVDVNIDHVVQQLLVDYDADQNGGLSASELASQPAIADCLSQCRRDSGQEITRDQLTKRLNSIFNRQSALVSATCVVRRNGQPLTSAEVKFIPLPVLQDVLPTGTGVTDSFGAAMISPAPGELPDEAPNVPGLMPPGLYLVEVTHPTAKIPEKYNKQTVLGKEVSSETVYRGGLAVDLKL
jgi:predicted small lipoprotein YifL